MLYKKTKNKQEGKPKDIDSYKGVIHLNRLNGKVAKLIEKEALTTKQIAEKLGVNIGNIHQCCRRSPYFNGTKQVNPQTNRWETYYSLSGVPAQDGRNKRIAEKLIKFLSKKPDMMYPAVYLSKKLEVSYTGVYTYLRNNPNIEVTTEREGTARINYYSIKS